jgi:hypothetical protein
MIKVARGEVAKRVVVMTRVEITVAAPVGRSRIKVKVTGRRGVKLRVRVTAVAARSGRGGGERGGVSAGSAARICPAGE